MTTTTTNATTDIELRTEDGRDPIARRLTVSELVATYERAEAEIRECFSRIRAAEEKLGSLFGDDHLTVQDPYGRVRFERPEESITTVRRRIWRSLVDHLELQRFMSIEEWKKLDSELERGEVLPINSETVTQMAEQFRARMPEMLEGAIQDVFNWLRPRNDRYKTNSQFEVPSKVVLSGVVERGFLRGFRTCYHYEQNLTALENVFRALDGKGQVSKSWRSELSNAIQSEECASGRGETEYFRFRCYKNRNLHLEFKRPDLLAKLNAKAGGKRLRGERAA